MKLKKIKPKKIVQFLKFLYYWMLCTTIGTKELGLNPYKKSPAKYWITKRVPGNKNSAVKLSIRGKITCVGYKGRLRRKANSNGVKVAIRNKNKENIEVVLIGCGKAIEKVVELAWKGTSRSRVENIIETWFNKPIKLEVNENINDQNNWSQEVANLNEKVIKHLGDLVKKANEYPEGNFSVSGELYEAAKEKNLFITRFATCNYIVSPIKALGFQSTLNSKVSTTVRAITDNKHLTKEFLHNNGLPVPLGRIFENLDDAKKYLNQCTYPLVVKPVEGSSGFGITVDVRTEEELEVAWDYAKNRHESIILEELIEGVDIRVIVIGGVAKAALLRVPANVMGDGKKTVADLINEKNQERTKNPRFSRTPIIASDYTESFLSKQGHSLTTIPKSGELVFLHLKANVGAGADGIVITEQIHPDLMQLAEEAANSFGINDYWGIDILAQRIDLPRSKQKCCILEANSRASFGGPHYPIYGKPTNIAKPLLNYLFPEKTDDNCYLAVEKLVRLPLKLDCSFEDWANNIANELLVNLKVDNSRSHTDVIVSGRKHHIDFFLNKLWCYKGPQGEVIDEQKIINKDAQQRGELLDSKADLETRGFDYVEHKVDSWLENSELDLDQHLFFKELTRLGFEVNFYSGNLIKFKKDELTGVSSMRFSSMFSDDACNNKFLFKKIITNHCLPTPRGTKFKVNQKENILKYFDAYASCIISSVNITELEPNKVNCVKELKKSLKQAKSKGVKYIYLEQLTKGWDVNIMVAAGEAIGSIIKEPTAIIGDGVSTVRELIEQKNVSRAKNPVYVDQAIEIDTLTDTFTMLGINSGDVLERGKRVVLEDDVSYQLGGETVNIDNLLHKEFKEHAVEAVKAIPGLKYGVVKMIIPDPKRSAKEQKWAISTIDTTPSISTFHFPLKGSSINVIEKVVGSLCLAEYVSTKKSKNSQTT
ncbi:ATP-grasp domain-containing protein [Proteinivorax tanatarense]|uniref:Acylphosphatase n=1 Tax=Proteinivorax tanatarense TaxID=1260629 RepID=A0AAU7VHR5_9FIRM